MSLDLSARRVTLASILYYSADHNYVTDGQFDELCAELAEEFEFLSPFRQWQLGSAEEIASSGFHIKATWWAVGAANAVLRPLGTILTPTSPPMHHEALCVDWFPVSGFQIGPISAPRTRAQVILEDVV
jgi:hypothetical protein